MDDHGTLFIGRKERSGYASDCHLSIADRRQHLYLIGKTGTGKSTLIRNLIVQDIEAGRGVGLIDPHGDLAREVLEHIPPHRFRDTVYFNPSDLERPIGLNLLDQVPEDDRHLVASGVVEAFKNIWADSWGPRLEYLLYNALSALLDQKGATILGIPKLLTDGRYRARVVEHTHDPMVRTFWLKEFPAYGDRLRAEVIAPLQNKVGRFLAAAPLRNILGQERSTIDLPFTMEGRRIFIANLSKGELGEDKANLIGSLLLTQFQLAAMRRARIPEAERPDFTLYIDEFHNFTTARLTTLHSKVVADTKSKVETESGSDTQIETDTVSANESLSQLESATRALEDEMTRTLGSGSAHMSANSSTRGWALAHGKARSVAKGEAEAFETIYKDRPTETYSVEEQAYRAALILRYQLTQYCVLQLCAPQR